MYKQTITILVILLTSSYGITQTLSIDETTEYLNKVLNQSPHKQRIRPPHFSKQSDYRSEELNKNEELRLMFNNQSHLYEGCEVTSKLNLSLDGEGYLLVKTIVTTTNCNDVKHNVENEIRKTARVNIEDIDIEDLSWYIPRTSSFRWDGELNDNRDECGEVFLKCNDKDVKCITVENKYYINSKYKESSLYLNVYSEDFKYDSKRFYNAFVYLISLAKEKGYVKKRDLDDPFASKPKTEKTVKESKKEYRAQLISSNGVFRLTANINGVNTGFILDSGAGECNISTETEQILLAKGVIKKEHYLNSGLFKLANGAIVECRRVLISKITVGGKTLNSVSASIGPEGSPNLLGQSFLNKNSQWTINNSTKVLILH